MSRLPAPSVSVIIPAYNAAPYIRETIESALKQTSSVSEIVVVDDGSREPVGWVTEIEPERVRYIWQENGGVAHARNTAVRHARGELLAFLDADDLWEPHKLACQLRLLADDPEVALVCSHMAYIDEQGRLMKGPSSAGASGWVFDQLFAHNFVNTSSVLLRREVFEAEHGFDERRDLAEDYELWLRIARRAKLAFLPEELVRYRVLPDSYSRDPRKAYARELRVIEEAVRRWPELAERLPYRFGALYLECAGDYWHRGQIGLACEQLTHSVQHWPWRLRPWLYYLVGTLLGSEGVATYRRLTRRPGVL